MLVGLTRVPRVDEDTRVRDGQGDVLGGAGQSMGPGHGRVECAVACLDREQRPLIRHQCGEKHLQVCLQNYRDAGVHAEVVSFIEDMQHAYAWADLAVCRAGALTISELTAVGLASLLIPFPYAVDNHQYHNARFLEQNQAAQILEEAGLSAENLALKLKFFQQNRDALVEMAVNARAKFQPAATEQLAAGILAGAMA